jgi:hypothetical protein
LSRTLVIEVFNSTTSVTYRTYASGQVIAYQTERSTHGVTDRTRWRASLWSAHPLLEAYRARHVALLAAEATWPELWRAITRWEDEEVGGD